MNDVIKKAGRAARFLLIPLLYLHGPTGREIEINAYDIASISKPGETKHFHAGTMCVLTLSNGKFIPVKESCLEVLDMITKLGEKRWGGGRHR